MKAQLYIETTIPSYLMARPSKQLRLAADQEATKEWWKLHRQGYELFISESVLLEISRGDSNFAAARLAAIRNLAILPGLPKASELTRLLLDEGIIPPKATDDATHLGLAAAHGMDYLLTWNCRHISNPMLRRRIERACAACGLECPVLCSPAEMMKGEP
jgi:hypothetical protein